MGCYPSLLLLNISSFISSLSQNSTSLLRLLESGSNTCMSIHFCHTCESANLARLIILSLGNPLYVPNGGKCLRYSTILFTWQKKMSRLESLGLNKPQCRYLLWNWSAFGGKKWVIRPYTTNLYFVVVSFPVSQVFC